MPCGKVRSPKNAIKSFTSTDPLDLPITLIRLMWGQTIRARRWARKRNACAFRTIGSRSETMGQCSEGGVIETRAGVPRGKRGCVQSQTVGNLDERHPWRAGGSRTERRPPTAQLGNSVNDYSSHVKKRGVRLINRQRRSLKVSGRLRINAAAKLVRLRAIPPLRLQGRRPHVASLILNIQRPIPINRFIQMGSCLRSRATNKIA